MPTIYINTFTSTNSTYRWDNEPLSANIFTVVPTKAHTFLHDVTGYAPYTSVNFKIGGIPTENTSTPYTTYINWNFNDYYNVNSNKLVVIDEEVQSVTHTFSMPGVYVIDALIRRVYKTPTGNTYINNCMRDGKFWRWDDIRQGHSNEMTWDQAAMQNIPWVDPVKCVDEYCIPWSWGSLTSSASTTVQWMDVIDVGKFSKTWYSQGLLAGNTCKQFHSDYTLNSTDTYIVAQYTVTVLEKSPHANLYHKEINKVLYLHPDGCLAGSFPLQKIIWDFNDGTDLFVVDRFNTHNLLLNEAVYFNNSFPLDVDDPRNYSIKYDYIATPDRCMFYPSITAYSCNTNSYDCCSTSIGPLEFKVLREDQFSLIKTRSYDNKIVLVSQQGKSTHLHTLDINNIDETIKQRNVITNTPNNKIKNFNGKLTQSNGNNGEEFVLLLANTLISR